MAGKGEDTRKRILDAAQAMILARGYAGMSVEALKKAFLDNLFYEQGRPYSENPFNIHQPHETPR